MLKRKIDPDGSLVLSILIHDAIVESLKEARKQENRIMLMLRQKRWKRRADKYARKETQK